MSDFYNYRYGDNHPIVAAIADAQALSIGDMAALVAGTIVTPADIAWATAIAAPTAPTAADGTAMATGLTNAATDLKISYNFPWGEGALSSIATATPTANSSIKLTGASLVPPDPATSTNIYVETAAGSDTFKLWGVITGASATVHVTGYGAGRLPPTAVASGALEITQYNFARYFLGVAGQRKAANATSVGHGGGPINRARISTRGVFDYRCASASWEIGDLFGPAKQSGNLLENQKVVAVAHVALAVGRVVEKAASVTTVRGEIFGKITTGGPQA